MTYKIVREDRTVQVMVSDCGLEDQPVDYARGNGMNTFRPVRLNLSLARDDNGPLSLKSAELVGPRVKKDGSPSVNWGRAWFSSISGDLPDNTPVAVRSLIESVLAEVSS